MYQFLWIFFIYAFLGWCTEVSYAALVTGNFVNRGFLNGPVCPVYGFGVVIVLACLTPLRHSFLLLFLGSVLLTSLLEWLTGFVLEKLFHQRWWDYSDQPFNLGGYICLRFSIAWGLACLFVVYILHPTVLLLIRLLPHTPGLALLCLFGAVMAVDLAATVRTIAHINRQLDQIDELAGRIKEMSNEFGWNLADKVLDAAEVGADWREALSDRTEAFREEVSGRTETLRENLEDLRESLAQKRDDLQDDLDGVKQALARRKFQNQPELAQLRDRLIQVLDGPAFGQRRLMRAFPKMRSTNHNQALEWLRRHLERK